MKFKVIIIITSFQNLAWKISIKKNIMIVIIYSSNSKHNNSFIRIIMKNYIWIPQIILIKSKSQFIKKINNNWFISQIQKQKILKMELAYIIKIMICLIKTINKIKIPYQSLKKKEKLKKLKINKIIIKLIIIN